MTSDYLGFGEVFPEELLEELAVETDRSASARWRGSYRSKAAKAASWRSDDSAARSQSKINSRPNAHPCPVAATDSKSLLALRGWSGV